MHELFLRRGGPGKLKSAARITSPGAERPWFCRQAQATSTSEAQVRNRTTGDGRSQPSYRGRPPGSLLAAVHASDEPCVGDRQLHSPTRELPAHAPAVAVGVWGWGDPRRDTLSCDALSTFDDIGEADRERPKERVLRRGNRFCADHRFLRLRTAVHESSPPNNGEPRPVLHADSTALPTHRAPAGTCDALLLSPCRRLKT